MTEFSEKAKHLVDKSMYPDIDKAVFEWFSAVRSPENRRLHPCRFHALIFSGELCVRLQDSKASDGWFRRWRSRFSVSSSVRLYGEASDVKRAEMEPIMEDFREKLQDYRVENIFNIYETGLFYSALPRRTYVSESEGNRSSVRGSKALSAKDRLTLVLCVNATGTFKVPPLIIGTAKNPYCFRDSPCPLPYTTQKNAWMDRTVFNEWRNTVFLPAVRAFIDDPVALLMDNCPGHDRFFVDPEGQYINLSTKA